MESTSRKYGHIQARAAAITTALAADAFTVRQNIAFAEGKYEPFSTQGRCLLAHELTHVVQQDKLPAASPKLSAADWRSAEARVTRAEAEADRIAEAPDDASVEIRETAPGWPQYAMRKGCVAPSFVVDKATASTSGFIAEAIVMADYCSKMDCAPFALDFFDNPLGSAS